MADTVPNSNNDDKNDDNNNNDNDNNHQHPCGIQTMKLYNHMDRVYNELVDRQWYDPTTHTTSSSFTVHDLSAIDSLHYLGNAAMDHGIASTNMTHTSRVLDIGSGLGGPARMLVHKTQCHVVALELQPELHTMAQQLTQLCSSSSSSSSCRDYDHDAHDGHNNHDGHGGFQASNITHVCGNFLQDEWKTTLLSSSPPSLFSSSFWSCEDENEDENENHTVEDDHHVDESTGTTTTTLCTSTTDVQSSSSSSFSKQVLLQFDIICSWLVFLHISDRPTLMNKIHASLAWEGVLYVEDFYQIHPFTESERTMLLQDVYVETLPTWEQTHAFLEEHGLELVSPMENVTESWKHHVKERLDQYRAHMDHHIRVQGKVSAEGLLHFYTSIHQLFDGGNLGGVIYTAKKKKNLK